MAESEGVTAPVEPASETAQAPAFVPDVSPASPPTSPPASASTSSPASSPVWRLGPIAVASGLTVSVLVHLALVGTVLIVSPLVGRPAPVYSVPVELVTPDEIPADKPKPDAPDKSTKPDEPDKSTKPDQPEQSTQTTPVEPQPQTAAALPLPPPSLPLGAFSLPQPPATRQAAAPPPPSGPAEQLANLIGLPVVGASGGPSDKQADLTSSAIAAFKAHVQSCWAVPAALANASARLHVLIRVNLRRDGRLAAEPEPMGGSGGADAEQAVRVLLPSAIEVLKKCQPYNVLPADKYNEWHALDLSFSPAGLVTASPPQHG